MGPAAARLEVVAGKAAGMSLVVDDELIIGRHAEGAGQLAQDDEISRQHARVVCERSGACTIEDLGSTNGTFVNGLRISVPQILAEGDMIEMGATTLVVRELPEPEPEPEPEPTASTDTHPAPGEEVSQRRQPTLLSDPGNLVAAPESAMAEPEPAAFEPEPPPEPEPEPATEPEPVPPPVAEAAPEEIEPFEEPAAHREPTPEPQPWDTPPPPGPGLWADPAAAVPEPPAEIPAPVEPWLRIAGDTGPEAPPAAELPETAPLEPAPGAPATFEPEPEPESPPGPEPEPEPEIMPVPAAEPDPGSEAQPELPTLSLSLEVDFTAREARLYLNDQSEPVRLVFEAGAWRTDPAPPDPERRPA